VYTNMTLKDGERVPFASYRCKATAKEVRKIGDSTYTHRCRLHIDHDGEHSCICGRHWEPLKAAS